MTYLLVCILIPCYGLLQTIRTEMQAAVYQAPCFHRFVIHMQTLPDLYTSSNVVLIRRRGRVQCGIVYCLSRNDCEKVAEELANVKQPNGRKLAAR